MMQTRQVDGSLEALVSALRWCGVEEDEGPNTGGPYGPYIQSQRLPIYQEHSEKLIEVCHCYFLMLHVDGVGDKSGWVMTAGWTRVPMLLHS